MRMCPALPYFRYKDNEFRDITLEYLKKLSHITQDIRVAEDTSKYKEVKLQLLQSGNDYTEGPDKFTTFAAPPHLHLTKPDTDSTNLFSEKFSRMTEDYNFNFESDIDVTLDAMGNWRDMLRTKLQNSSGLDFQVYNGEMDRAEKFGIVKGKRPHWALPDYQARDPDLPTDFVQWADNIVRDSVSISEDYVMFAEFDPPNVTNAGYPTYMAGPLAKLISNLLYNRTFDQLYSNCLNFSNYMGIPSLGTLAYGVNARISASSKPIPIFMRDSTNFIQIAELVNGGPAVRQVWMASAVLNTAISNLVVRSKAVRMALHRLGIFCWHDQANLDEGARRINTSAYIEEIDQSAYDKHVGKKLQKMMRDVLMKYLPHLSAEIDCWFNAEQLPFMTKDLYGRANFGTIITRSGQTSSGLAMTSDIGTLINVILTTYTLSKLWNISYTQLMYELKTGLTTLLILGDDLLIGTGRYINESLFSEIQKGLGFDVKILKGVRFLSKQYVPSGIRPIAASVIQQTVSHERPPKGSYKDVAPIKVIGFLSRWSIGPYDSLVQSTSQVISTIPFYKELGINDGKTAQDWLDKHPTDVNNALESRANMSYLLTIINEAEFSPSANSIFQTMTKMGVDFQKIFELDRRVKTIMKSFMMLEERKRFELAMSLYARITRGRSDTSIIGQYEQIFDVAKIYGVA